MIINEKEDALNFNLTQNIQEIVMKDGISGNKMHNGSGNCIQCR